MTAKRANKPHRLSTLLATLAFNDYSDYEGAPESSDFRALPLRLSTFRLFDFAPATLSQADAPPEAPAERSGQTHEKIGLPTLDTPGTPPATPGPGPAHGGPRSPQAGALAAGYASPTPTGTAHRWPQETPHTETEGTQMPHGSAGRAQDERKIKPGEFTPGKRKCSTEPPRRRHAKRAGGWQNAPAGENPHQGEKKPAGSVAPGGYELL